MAEKADVAGSTEKDEILSKTGELEEALRKCLSENNGDQTKCRSKVQAIQSPSSSTRRVPRKKLAPFRLRKGSIIDV